MKNIFKLLTILIIITVLISNCTKKFDEINTNPKTLTTANLDASTYGFVIRTTIYFQMWLGNQLSFQTGKNLYLDVYANYFATTAPNFLSDRYVMVGGWLSGIFNNFYVRSATHLKYALDYAKENDLAVEEAMMKIWKVYSYNRYTDLVGPMVYSSFGNMEKSVPYDKQEDIYTNFFKLLDEANAVLKANAGKTSAIFATYDPIYAGKVDLWQKFGSSLRLRLALRVKYVKPELAKTQAEKAIAEGVMTSNADNGWVKTTTDWYNTYTLITQWGEFRMSADMESFLKGYADPRVSAYFSEAKAPDLSDDPAGLVFKFEGMRNGQSKNDRSAFNFNNMNSDMAAPYLKAGDKGPNMFVMRAFECYFLRAEGALEGWNMGGTTESLYKSGIETSLAENGFANLKNLKGEVYSTSTLVPASPGADGSAPTVIQAPVSTVPVAFMTGGTKEQKLEQIITQKWIGLYPDSGEAYAERRRTRYPKLFDRLDSENPDVPKTSIPARLTYWSNEYNTNNAEVLKAITMLNAESSNPQGDKANTKLWWDKKP
ncbi:MAG: SusD/RagB family nutrient-binding outer membrane lipoprotein [Prolixibacteraceae bacterium]|jgi:hypothetical protein|nr:SusD/RagB family nutrient-binding outer membrane lipoprotein [Prolixibacteraceae bacterium]